MARERASRLHAEEALRRTEEKFRALVEQSIVGIYVIQDDRFTYVNPQMAEIFGVSSGELQSRSVYDFVWPEDRTLVRDNIRKRLQGIEASIRYILRIPHSSGEARFRWATHCRLFHKRSGKLMP